MSNEDDSLISRLPDMTKNLGSATLDQMAAIAEDKARWLEANQLMNKLDDEGIRRTIKSYQGEKKSDMNRRLKAIRRRRR